MTKSERRVSPAIVIPLKLLWALLVLLVPRLGFWLASSLAVYMNGPLWLALLAGLFFFPVFPLTWDAISNVRRRRRRPQQRPRLSDSSRILLRVLATNLVLTGGLLAFYPEGAFRALSTRGDWMLEGRNGEWPTKLRPILFGAADRLEWLYELARTAQPLEREENTVSPTPHPKNEFRFNLKKYVAQTSTRTESTDGSAPEHTLGPEPVPNRPTAHADLWPMPKQLHPLASGIPPEAETSYESVARYIAENERDPYMRIKAIHDYIADRVRYDVHTMRSKDPRFRASQDPKTVFDVKLAVCDGYSQLFEAMVVHTGGQAVYIGGESRDSEGNVSDVGHAWNGVVINGYWYLVDVTWDAGHIDGGEFVKQYSSDYLLTPPKLFAITHFPSHEKWQLLDVPISRGEFMRTPMLRPSFHAQGLKLISPDRSQVTVEGNEFEAQLENPGMFYLIGTMSPRLESRNERCVVRYEGSTATIRCVLPSPGQYIVRMFGARVAHGSYEMIGAFDVNAT